MADTSRTGSFMSPLSSSHAPDSMLGGCPLRDIPWMETRACIEVISTERIISSFVRRSAGFLGMPQEPQHPMGIGSAPQSNGAPSALMQLENGIVAPLSGLPRLTNCCPKDTRKAYPGCDGSPP